MKLPKLYDPAAAEPVLRQLWMDHTIYRFDPQSDQPVFSVDTPPPYVSADHLHAGHIMSYTQAEIIVRYKRMKGFNVFYPMGFDDNGLPTERFVEKKYKIEKSTISRTDFIELCLEETTKGAQIYRNLWELLGISVDWSLRYSTMDARSRRTAQKSFIELFRQNRIERRNEPGIRCFNCGSSLAQADLGIIEEETELHNIEFTDCFGHPLTISTTRPELLGSCVAVYAHPSDERYARLIGSSARTPVSGHEVPVKTHRSVDPEFGTGLMMVCTWGDADDVIKWKEDGLMTRAAFEPDGRLSSFAAQFSGMTVPEARTEILRMLASEGRLKGSRSYRHTSAIHDRCGTKVEYAMSPQWFLRIMDLKDELLNRGCELEWFPGFMKARFDEWVKNLKWDWCISRQRYYGVPFPVWFCAECDRPLIGPESMLPVDPIRENPPDGSICSCGCCNFKGDPDVMDTWMTSSMTPLINSHWADSNGPIKDSKRSIYPMSLRVQAFEIIRTWLFYSIVKSHLHSHSLPWKQVMISGWGLDRQGKKISKSEGNYTDPELLIRDHSADALRYWASGATLGTDLRFSEDDLKSGRRLIVKLWNAARLIDGWNPENIDRAIELKQPDASSNHPLTSPLDRWIVHRFRRMLDGATEALERYEYCRARDLAERFFFQDFCDNYLEAAKSRFRSQAEGSQDISESTRRLCNRLLMGILKLFAPFIPYLTDTIYQLMFRQPQGCVSIHIESWPDPSEFPLDNDSEICGAVFLAVMSSIRKWKTTQGLHAGSPVSKITICCGHPHRKVCRDLLPDIAGAARAESVSLGSEGSIDTSFDGIQLEIQTIPNHNRICDRG